MKILVCGALGRMGREICRLAEDKSRHVDMVAAADAVADGNDGVFRALADIPTDISPDVMIDVSHRRATREVLSFAVGRSMPLVLATTGQTPAEEAAVRRASAYIPVLHSGNMSVGIACLLSVAADVLAALPEADAEIIEIHHAEKDDAPSGTCDMILESLRRVRPHLRPVYGRVGFGKRDKNEIGIHSLRQGSTVGIHEIRFSDASETVIIRHEAQNISLFAEGMLRAARFLCGREAGFYSMQDIT